MKKHLVRWGIIAIVIVFIVFGFTLRPVGDGEEIAFRVESGDGLRHIAAGLERDELIRSRIFFSLYTAFTGRAGSLKPGLYQLSDDMRGGEILSLLHSGPRDIVITIIEGETVVDIDQALSDAGIIKAGEFVVVARAFEGFLFPDTYRVSPDMTPIALVNLFAQTFAEKVAPTNAQLAEAAEVLTACLETSEAVVDCEPVASSHLDVYNKLIVASLIEKEVPVSAERKIAADVIYKRLGIDMPIQVDAAIVYEVCGGTFYNCRPLVRSDFQVESAYNTYTRIGLPPAPIGNPGVDAIEAAFHPQTSPYWYYLSDPETGMTLFSETFEEHNEKRARYLGL